MATIDELVKRIDDTAEPDWTWEASSEEVIRGLNTINKNDDYNKKTKGGDLIAKQKAWATEFYSGKKSASESEMNHYFMDMQQMLGDNYGAWRDAVKKGKRHEQAKLVADAVENRNLTTIATITAEEVSNLPPDDQISLSKKIADFFGDKTKDYVRIGRNIPQAIQNLSRYKQQAEVYSPS